MKASQEKDQTIPFITNKRVQKHYPCQIGTLKVFQKTVQINMQVIKIMKM